MGTPRSTFRRRMVWSRRWTIRSEGLALPAALTGLMERRLERLSPATRRVLNVAAVVGRVFDIDLVMEAGEVAEDALLDALDEGIQHAAIEPWGDTSTTHFSFAHGLLVDAMRGAMNSRRLARIHERVGRAMEGMTPGNVAEIAMHFDCAGVAPQAYRYSLLAGTAALAVYAHAEARRFFEIAERTAGTPEERARALHCLAEVAESEGM